MSEPQFEIITRQGVDPTRHKYPGLGYRRSGEQGMLVERDVAVPMRDGVKLYADVHRPEGGGKVPAIVAWSPYGKHRAFQWMQFLHGPINSRTGAIIVCATGDAESI